MISSNRQSRKSKTTEKAVRRYKRSSRNCGGVCDSIRSRKRFTQNADNDFNNSSSAITNESTNQTALAYSNINIYYLNGSSTEKTTKYLACDAKVIFPSGKSSIASAMMYVLSSALSTATVKRRSTTAQSATLSATKQLLN